MDVLTLKGVAGTYFGEATQTFTGVEVLKIQTGAAGTGDFTFRNFLTMDPSTDGLAKIVASGDNSLILERPVKANEIDASGLTGDAFLKTMALAGATKITGSEQDDHIVGSSENDVIIAGAGNDKIFGLAGNDTITGGAGADVINAGAGANIITDAGVGADVITHDYSGSTVAIAVTGTDTVTLTATQTGATVNSKDGVNTTVNASTSTAALTLNGGTGDDTFTGGSRNDTIKGGDGNDSISLAAGGADTVVFGASLTANGVDTITGFNVGTTANGGDVLNFGAFIPALGGLEGLGADLTGAFSYLTAGATTGGTNIANKIFLWEGTEAQLAALVDTAVHHGKLGLARGDKAIALIDDPAGAGSDLGDAKTFTVVYITGTGTDDEIFDTVGTVGVDLSQGLVAANFGFVIEPL